VCKNLPLKIENFTGEELTLEELHAKFFYSRRGSLHTTIKPKKKLPNEENNPKHDPVSETGENGGLSKYCRHLQPDRGQFICRISNEVFSDCKLCTLVGMKDCPHLHPEEGDSS